MTPSIDDRLQSIIRSLETIVLPSLPATASLAREQAELIIGHLHILQAQLDSSQEFEREELMDAINLAARLVALRSEPELANNASMLEKAIESAQGASDPAGLRLARIELHRHIDSLISTVFAQGSTQAQVVLKDAVFKFETRRIPKDRDMMAVFGFDSQGQ